MSATFGNRVSRRRRNTRFVLVVGAFVVLASVVATGLRAASFDDTGPCVASGSDPAILVCPAGAVGSPYSVQLKGRDGCNLYTWEVANGSLPSGLSMTRRGLISGTPTGAGRSQFWLVIRELKPEEGGYDWCTNVDNNSQREHAIIIDSGMVVTTETAPAGFTGTPYSLTLAAAMSSGGGVTSPVTSPVTWEISGGQLPPGLALNTATGILSGTPTQPGTFPFTVRASIPSGQISVRDLVIDIKAQLVLTPPSSIEMSEVGLRVELPFGATGGVPPYIWSISAGALPTGVVLTQAGTVTGRAREAGDFSFTVSVADAGGQVQTFPASLTVAARLAIDSTSSLAPGTVGKRYRSRLTTTGGVAPVTWRLVRGSLPRGVRFAPRTGTFLGVPRVAGRSKLRVVVADSLGVQAGKWYLLKISPAPKPKKKPAAKR